MPAPSLLVLPVALAVALCVTSAVAAPTSSAGYGEAREVGALSSPALDEVSGLAASSRQAGVLWVVNDSGDRARLYALSRRGRLLAVYTVAGAINVDWEAVVAGPGPAGTPSLYIADIGDNARGRSALSVYRVEEPVVPRGRKRVVRGTVRATELRFRYPDGPHDAEALIVDPRTARLYVITKSLRGGALYRLPPQRAQGVQTARRIGGAAGAGADAVRLATDASVSPDGRRVVVRSYFGALEFTRTGRGVASAFAGPRANVDLPFERQGEAITYTASGSGLLTTSEGVGAPIWRLGAQTR